MAYSTVSELLALYNTLLLKTPKSKERTCTPEDRHFDEWLGLTADGHPNSTAVVASNLDNFLQLKFTHTNFYTYIPVLNPDFVTILLRGIRQYHL